MAATVAAATTTGQVDHTSIATPIPLAKVKNEITAE
jgi:hypothetical protein